MRKHKRRPQAMRMSICGNHRALMMNWALTCQLWIAAKLVSSRRRTLQLLIQTCHAVRIRCFLKQMRQQLDRSRFQRNSRNFRENPHRQQRPLHRSCWIKHLLCTSKNRPAHWNYETRLPVSAQAQAQITAATVVVAVAAAALSSLNRLYSVQHVVLVSAKMDANWRRRNRWKRTPHSNGKSQEYSNLIFFSATAFGSTNYLIINWNLNLL